MHYIQVGPKVVAAFSDQRDLMKAINRLAPGINVEIKKTHYTGECSGPKHNTSEKIFYLKPGDFTL